MSKDRVQLIIAGVSSALAVLAVFMYTATVRAEAGMARAEALERYGGDRAQVLVATTDIDAGQELGPSNTALMEWAVDLLPQGEVALDPSQVEGMVAQVALKQNEPVLLERVGTGSARIAVPEGLEAVTVSSDDVLAVGGAIRTGSLVDVYVETGEGKIVQLGKHILVLETNSGGKEGVGGDITWVTLAVTPESTQELLSASVRGTIHLVLPSSSAAKGGESK